MKPCGDCGVEPVTNNVNPKTIDFNKVTVAHLSIEGMGCEHCATRVRNSFLLMDGVLTARVDLDEGIAVVVYDPEKVTPHRLLSAVRESGRDGKHGYWPNLLSLSTAREAFPGLARRTAERAEDVHPPAEL